MEFSLYQITNAFPTLMENTEISEEDKKKIEDELTLLLQQKSQSIIGYTKNIELTIEAMKSEEKRIAEQRKALENRLIRFKEYVKNCMDNNEIKKIETTLGTITVAKSPISVEIVSEEQIPEEFKQQITTTKIDKKAISKYFADTGEIVNGVKINTQNTYLKIR